MSKAEVNLESLRDTIGSKLYRLNNFYKIRTKDARLINFRFNTIQQRIYETFKNQSPIHQFYLKYRQGGVSTFWLLWWLDETIFTPNTVTGILAHKWESLHHLWNIIEIAWKNFPDQWRPQKAEPTKTRLAFPSIGSEIFISLSIRSIGLNNLHISEWCFCDSQEVEATLGACGPYTCISGESTGNGVGNHGYLTYQDAKKRLGPYDAHFYPWFIQTEYSLSGEVPTLKWTSEERRMAARAEKEYGVIVTPAQMLWRRQKKQELKKLFAQEFPENDEEAFMQSGGRYFDTAKAMALLEEAREWQRTHDPVEETEDYTKWEDPDPDSVYVAGADVAEGGGTGDWSVLVILNATKKTTAFRYRAQCGIDVFYRVCDKWGRFYRGAWLAIEKNNHGHAVIQGLLENCLYPNLYYRQKPRRYKEPTQIVNDPSDRLLRAGWVTDGTTKPMMLDALKEAIEEGSDVDVEHFNPDWSIVDMLLLEEVLTVVEVSGKLNAESGKHDDVVIAYAIANQLFQQVQMHMRHGKDLGIRIGTSREIPLSNQAVAGVFQDPRG
jgi:hypothetical protein